MSAVLSFSNRLADFCTSCFSSWRLDKWRWAADNFSAMSCCSEPTLSSLLVSSCSTSWCWITTWNKQLIQCITNFTQDTRSVRPGYVTLNRNLTSYHWLWQSNGTRHRTSKTEQALRYVTLRCVTLRCERVWVESRAQSSVVCCQSTAPAETRGVPPGHDSSSYTQRGCHWTTDNKHHGCHSLIYSTRSYTNIYDVHKFCDFSYMPFTIC